MSELIDNWQNVGQLIFVGSVFPSCQILVDVQSTLNLLSLFCSKSETAIISPPTSSWNTKIKAGDLIGWAMEWNTNTRSRIWFEAFAEPDLVLANTGTVSTFRRTGSYSTVNLTYLSTTLVWFVSAHYTHSDYQAISLQIANRPCSDVRSRGDGVKGWSV